MFVTECVKTISTDRMRQVEDKAHAMGMLKVYMMENAGAGVAEHLVAKFRRLAGKKVVAVAGTGNNGGDALVAARHLTYYGAKVSVILLGGPHEIKTEEARINWGILERMNSVEIILAKELSGEVVRMITKADIIIDGIFGTGIRGSVAEPHSSAIDAINNSRAYKVAVDVPSGLDPDTGRIHDRCVRADATVTFYRMKPGLLKNRKFCGKTTVRTIGVPPEVEVDIP